jgi:hypothetical protein
VSGKTFCPELQQQFDNVSIGNLVTAILSKAHSNTGNLRKIVIYPEKKK